MKGDTKKYFEVNIIDITNSWERIYAKDIRCADMSEEEITNYMKTINSCERIPEKSCLYHISFDFQQTFQRKIVFSTQPDEKKSNRNHDGEFCIRLRLKNCCKCHPHDCFFNIQNGKCCDDFTRKIICEELLKDKYQKQK